MKINLTNNIRIVKTGKFRHLVIQEETLPLLTRLKILFTGVSITVVSIDEKLLKEIKAHM